MDLPVQHSTHSKNATTLRYKSELLTYVVHSVVHSVVEGLVAVRVVSGIVTGTDNLARFVTTLGTDDGAVVCKDDVRLFAGTGHFTLI